jgi:hypothetical protein
MRSVTKKCVAMLLLVIISTFLGGTLAENVACAGHVAGSQIVVVTNDGSHDDSACNLHHCMSCEVFLCSGFSGAMLVTKAAMPLEFKIENAPFALFENDRLPSETFEPLVGPPRA